MSSNPTLAVSAPLALSPPKPAAVNGPAAAGRLYPMDRRRPGRRAGPVAAAAERHALRGVRGLIEDALCRVEGVRQAEVSGAAQRAVVTWDPQHTQVSVLIEAVQRAGYGAFPDTGAQAVALATPRDTAVDLAPVRGGVLHDAGDDVRHAGLRRRPGRHHAGHGATAALGELGAEHSGDRVRGGAVLPGGPGGACASGASAWTCPWRWASR